MAIQKQSQNPAVSQKARESQTTEPKPKPSHLRSFLSRAVMALVVLSCVIAAVAAFAAAGGFWRAVEQAKSVSKEAPAEQNDQAQSERKAGIEPNLEAQLEDVRKTSGELDKKITGLKEQLTRDSVATGTPSTTEGTALRELNQAIDNLVASLQRQTANPAQARPLRRGP
jgi:hypothetical protein